MRAGNIILGENSINVSPHTLYMTVDTYVCVHVHDITYNVSFMQYCRSLASEGAVGYERQS